MHILKNRSCWLTCSGISSLGKSPAINLQSTVEWHYSLLKQADHLRQNPSEIEVNGTLFHKFLFIQSFIHYHYE